MLEIVKLLQLCTNLVLVKGILFWETLKKVTKSPKGGGGSAPEIKKSTIQNVNFLIKRGVGRPFSHFLPNVNSHFEFFSGRKNKLVLK